MALVAFLGIVSPTLGEINAPHIRPMGPTPNPLRQAKSGSKRIPKALATEKIIPLQVKTSSKSKPLPLKELSKKTTVIDARRLTEHKLTETIRYVKSTKDPENKDLRLKIQNATINSTHFIKILNAFEAAGILNQVREICFVMLPGEKKNQELQSAEFIKVILPKIKNLEGIELSCLGVTDKFIENIAKETPHLKSISLFGLGITDATLTKLEALLPKLTKLKLVNTSISPKGIHIIVTKFPELRTLGLSGQHLNDSDFIALKEGVGNLHSFSAVGQSFKDMQTLKSLLSAMTSLKMLDLSESNVNDEVARYIADEAPGLKILDISETKISGAGLKEIAQRLDLQQLKINRLRGIGPEDLDFIIEKQRGLTVFHFAGTSFTNVLLMKMIMELPHLIDVTLIPGDSSWMLTEGVAHALILRKTPRYQYLHIQANRLPESLRALFEKELPTLRIEYAASGPFPL